MTKSILKEISIILLLFLAIILVLGIVLYEYVPISKTVPAQVAYTTPEEVKEELLEAGELDDSQIIMTYEVNGDDLNNYKRVQNYKPGKANPFSSYEKNTQVNGQSTSDKASSSAGNSSQVSNSTSSGSTTSGSTSTGSSSSESTTSSNTSGGQFFQDKGIK